ncbi:MAG: CBS domain-containing protein [Candidatus Omnitrophota bacterium]
MKVKEIMTKDVKSLSGEETVKDALDIISRLEISGLPVIDKDKNLLGMFTEKDVLRIILPGYLTQVGAFVYGDDPKNIKNKFLNLHNLKVTEAMNKAVETVKEDTSLSEAARLMLTKNVRRMPVLDANKKVTGIISRYDVLAGLRRIAEV